MAIQTFVADTILTAAQMNALQGNDYNQTVSTKTASYTLVAADKGTKVVMNSASATTITVNTSLFSAGDTLTILNISTGVCTVTAGTATVSTAGSLALAQNGGGTLYFTSAGVSVFQADGITAAASGLVCVKAETAFSAVASVTADSVFTSTYTNYVINLRWTTTLNSLALKFRAGGTSTSTNYNRQMTFSNGGTATSQQDVNTTSFDINSTSGNFKSNAQIIIAGPQLSEQTVFTVTQTLNSANYTTGLYWFGMAGNQNSTTAFDGIEFLVPTGTTTGVYAIYGYSKTV